MLTTLIELAGVFAMISLISVGGGNATLPEIKRLTIGHYHWVTSQQFVSVYALGQLAPGPSSLYVAAIGYGAAGVPGALVAEAAILLPSSILMFVMAKLWRRFVGSPWQAAVKKGLAPVTIGLMLAGTYSIASVAVTNVVTAAIGAVVCLLLLRTRINPALLVISGGGVSWLLLH